MDRDTIRKKILLISLFFLACFFLLFKHDQVCGQLVNEQLTNIIDQNQPGNQTRIINTLDAILQSIEALQPLLRSKEEALQDVQTEDLRNKIVNEIIELHGRIESLEKNFEVIATGVDLEQFTQKSKKRLDWQEEIKDLLSPIIQEVKNATAHPREIEKLRNDIAFYKEQILIIEKGILNLQKHIEEIKEQKLKDHLITLKKNWTIKNQNISSQLTIVEYQLTEKLKGQKSFIESIQNVLRIFFKSRGRNLLLALLAFILVWLLFYFLHSFSYKITHIKKSKKRSLYTRLIALIYHILTFVCAMGALLLVLYISGDWVLLGLAIIFLIGLAWATRQALPRFWEQVKLLLNLGPVKENERLVYNGIPWKVQSLNFYTPLINPVLKGGMIRLPLRKLTGLHSRPYHPDEPWFASKEGDWLILADGTYGKVLNQTPEMVELVLLGGSHKIYQISEFLRQNPMNISTNFRLNVTFGIDYQHQSISTRQVPEKLQKNLIEGLLKEGFENDIINISVEFKEASASSLDFEVLADFSGQAAKDYKALSRAIQRICVESCNECGWIIPFTQITLHTQGASSKDKCPMDQ